MENSCCIECIKKDGGCCTEVRFSIHEDEVSPFLEKFRQKSLLTGHSLKIDKKRKIYEYSSGKNQCIFLNEGKECSIYMKRPTTCRTYPLFWKKNTKMQKNYYIDMSCPLTLEIPLKTILSWSKDETNIKSMSSLGDLDFDGREKYYLNCSIFEEI